MSVRTLVGSQLIPLLFYVLILLLIYILIRYRKKEESVARKGFTVSLLVFATLLVTSGYIYVRMIEHKIQEWRIKTAPSSAKVESENATLLVWDNLSVRSNQTSGPTFDRFFFETPVDEQIEIPQLPEPYSKFAFLLSGYKVGNNVKYNSPWLPEAELPKPYIEETILHFPNSKWEDPRYKCFTKTSKRNDTTYFRTLVEDWDKLDNVLPDVIEPVLRYSRYGGSFYKIPPYTRTVLPEPWGKGLLIVHHRKAVYRNTLFDTTKMVQVAKQFDAKNAQEFSIRLYVSKDEVNNRVEEGVVRLWRTEWRLLIYFTLALILLLRGFTIREAITGWWKKRKQIQ